MKRRNWKLIALSTIAISWFVLSRTVWGPPNRAAAGEAGSSAVAVSSIQHDRSNAECRFLANQPRHWRELMLNRN